MKTELEEVAEKLYLSYENNEFLYGHSEELQLAYKAGIIDGALWQQERMYSDMQEYADYCLMCSAEKTFKVPMKPKEWFKNYKK